MNVAVGRRRLTTPAQVRRPLSVLAGALLAAAVFATPPVLAQQGSATPAASTAAGGAAAPHAKRAATHAAAKGESATMKAPANTKSQASYSIGVSMGDQLHSMGLTQDSVALERLSQGLRDALSGKVKMTEADQENVANIIRSARQGLVQANHGAAATFLAENAKKKDVVTTASGLQYKVIAPGSGASPKATDEVSVNYKGSLLDGTVFDASENHGGPATFPVDGVIPGWTEALMLMKPGAKWQLFIPPKLAYDERSPGPIPPGSMLMFDVELLSVKPHAATAPTRPGQSATQPSAPR